MMFPGRGRGISMDQGHSSFVGCPTPNHRGLEVIFVFPPLQLCPRAMYGACCYITMPPTHSMTQGWCLSYAHGGLDVSEEEEEWVDIIMTNSKHPHTQAQTTLES